jgi:hypothetical protein
MTTAASAVIVATALVAATSALAFVGGSHGGGHPAIHSGGHQAVRSGWGGRSVNAPVMSSRQRVENGRTMEAAPIQPRDYVFNNQRSHVVLNGGGRLSEARADRRGLAPRFRERGRAEFRGFDFNRDRGRNRRFNRFGSEFAFVGAPFFYGDDYWADDGYYEGTPYADDSGYDQGPPAYAEGPADGGDDGSDQAYPGPGPGYQDYGAPASAYYGGHCTCSDRPEGR